MMSASIQPPKKPAAPPRSTAPAIEIAAPSGPASREIRAPYSRRESWSRPNPSVPSTCCRDGGEKARSRACAAGSYGARNPAKIAKRYSTASAASAPLRPRRIALQENRPLRNARGSGGLDERRPQDLAKARAHVPHQHRQTDQRERGDREEEVRYDVAHLLPRGKIVEVE